MDFLVSNTMAGMAGIDLVDDVESLLLDLVVNLFQNLPPPSTDYVSYMM